jgi:hypothetical protein
LESNTYDGLRAQVEYPESWRPEPGDTIVGEAVAWSDYHKTDETSGEEKTCKILTLRDEAGVEHGIWCWHSILRSELANVRPGDLVAISYTGKKPRQKGDGAYHHYRVAVQAAALSEPVGEARSAQDDDIPF